MRHASRADGAAAWPAGGGLRAPGLGLGLSWRLGLELRLHDQGGAMGGGGVRPLHAGALLEAEP